MNGLSFVFRRSLLVARLSHYAFSFSSSRLISFASRFTLYASSLISRASRFTFHASRVVHV